MVIETHNENHISFFPIIFHVHFIFQTGCFENIPYPLWHATRSDETLLLLRLLRLRIFHFSFYCVLIIEYMSIYKQIDCHSCQTL